MDDILLSIVIPTYNHEKYIARALDSVLSQNIPYCFEVLVGEDCSKDKTKAILKDYEKKYPGFFNVYYREKNMYGSIPSNLLDLYLRTKGKYIITLEGDDYWIDNNKIRKQLEFLEEHPDYIACAHNCLVVDENGNPRDVTYPECKEKVYTIKDFKNKILPGQTATIMCRNVYRDKVYNTSILKKALIPGDRLKIFVLLSYGKIYCMQEKMSAYRYVTKSGTSYSASYKYNYHKEMEWYRNLLDYSRNFGNTENQIAIEEMYFHESVRAWKKGQCSKKDVEKTFSSLKYKLRVTLNLGITIIYNRIKKLQKKDKNDFYKV